MKLIVKIYITLLLICISGVANGQSIRTNSSSKEPAREVIRKLSSNTFEKPSAGVVSYKIEDNKIWALFSGIPEETGARGSYRETPGKVAFYDKEDNLVGYYEVAQGRFYETSASGDTILKELSVATLLDGVLYINTFDGPPTQYAVEADVDIMTIGFYLFIL